MAHDAREQLAVGAAAVVPMMWRGRTPTARSTASTGVQSGLTPVFLSKISAMCPPPSRTVTRRWEFSIDEARRFRYTENSLFTDLRFKIRDSPGFPICATIEQLWVNRGARGPSRHRHRREPRCRQGHRPRAGAARLSRRGELQLLARTRGRDRARVQRAGRGRVCRVGATSRCRPTSRR